MAKKTSAIVPLVSYPGIKLILMGLFIFIISMFDFCPSDCAWWDLMCKSGTLACSGSMFVVFGVLKLAAFVIILIGLYRFVKGRS